MQPSVEALRGMIAKHEAGLLSARSPRLRLGHSFRLAIAKDLLAQAEAGQ